MRWTLAVAASLVVLACVPFDLLPWLRGPAPYPPEWQWGYRPEGPAHPLLAATACALAVVGLVALSGTAWAERRARRVAAGLVLAAIGLGSILPIALLARDPAGPVREAMRRVRSPAFTSYHSVAASEEARDPLSFLRRHAELLSTFTHTAKHAATHPPGPVLFYRGMIGLCEASPRLTAALLEAASVPAGYLPPQGAAARAGALLGVLVLVVTGSLTSWPLARLAERLGLDALGAARVSLLWALVPGPALMTPQFDQAMALPATASTLLLLGAAETDSRRALVARASLAGVLGGIALWMSYGALVFFGIGGLAAVAGARPSAPSRMRLVRWGALAAVASALAALVAFAVPALLGHQPLVAMRNAMAIHRSIYTDPRSYRLWLVFDLVDLSVFLGVTIAVLAFLRAVRAARRAVAGAPLAASARFALATVVGVLALDLLGVTRGEVGRLWTPLMPLLLLSACVGEDRRDSGVAASIVLAALTAATTLALAAWWTV